MKRVKYRRISFQEDVKLSGYKKHLTAQAAPAPLTMAEEELEDIKRNEVGQKSESLNPVLLLVIGKE